MIDADDVKSHRKVSRYENAPTRKSGFICCVDVHRRMEDKLATGSSTVLDALLVQANLRMEVALLARLDIDWSRVPVQQVNLFNCTYLETDFLSFGTFAKY